MATTQTSRTGVTSGVALVQTPGLISTSVTSLAIGTGAKTLTVGLALQFQAGQQVIVADAANAANYMQGAITSYNAGTGALVINVPVGATSGSGTKTAWNVSIAGAQGVTGAAGSNGTNGSNAPALTGTSTTSVAIGTGAQTFTTQAGLGFAAGQQVIIADQANAANYMHGSVTSYSGATLVTNITDIGGSGTKTAWNLSISGTQGSQGPSGGGGPVPSAQSSNFNGSTTTNNTFYVASASLVGTLPDASSTGVAVGWRLGLKNQTDGADVTWLANPTPAAGTDLIDGQTGFRVPGRSTVYVIKDATNSWTVEKEPSHMVGETIEWKRNVLPAGGWAWANGVAASRATLAGLFKTFCPQATVTMTIASPGVVTSTGHGYPNGQGVVLRTSGALPTGLTAGTKYYMVSVATNTFQLAATPGGSAIVTTGSQSGTHTANFTDYGDGDGSTTFGIPDDREYAKVGTGTMGGSSDPARLTSGGSGIKPIALNQSGGTETVTLTTAQLASHAHSYTKPDAAQSNGGCGSPVSSNIGTGATTGTQGSDTAHQNTQPTITTNYIIKT